MLHDAVRRLRHVVGLAAEVQANFALHDLALRALQKLHERQTRDRFAAAGLADDADSLADGHGERDAVDRLDNARVGEKVGVQVVEFDRVVGVVHLGQILGFGNVLALALLFERICDLAVFFGNAAGFLCGKIAVIMLLSHSNSLLSQRFIFGSNASRRPSPTKLKPRTVSIRQMPAGIQMNQ